MSSADFVQRKRFGSSLTASMVARIAVSSLGAAGPDPLLPALAQAGRYARRPDVELRRVTPDAGPVLGRIDVARSAVSGLFGEGAERHRALGLLARLAAGKLGGDDSVGRLALLNPGVERGERVEVVGTVAAEAVKHARRHEEARVVADLVVAARRIRQVLVKPHRTERGNRRVAVAVIENELLPRVEEGREPVRLVGVADREPFIELTERVVRDPPVGLRPIVVEVDGGVAEIDEFGEALGGCP